MANQRIQMFLIKRIIELRLSNKSKRLIAKILGISRNTLDGYLDQLFSHNSDISYFSSWTEAQLVELFNTPTVNITSPYPELYALFPSYVKELTRVGVSRVTLWAEYNLAYPTGLGYRQFCARFERWRDTQKVTMHFEHKAGDKLFVDFAGDRLHLIDAQTGEQITVEFFVAILPCSQLTYAQAVMSQKKEDFILALNNTLVYFGGVPQAIVPDNLKSAVTKADKYEPEIKKHWRISLPIMVRVFFLLVVVNPRIKH